MNELIRQIITLLSTEEFSNDQLRTIDNVLWSVLGNYTFQQKETLPSVEIDDTRNIAEYFLACCRIDGKSEFTIAQYKRCIDKFFMHARCNFRDVNKEVTRSYLVHLQHQAYSIETVNDYMKGISAFYTWLVNEEYLSKSPFKSFHSHKDPNKRIKRMTGLEMAKARDICKTRREKVFVALTCSTGMRVNELAHIDIVRDLDLTKKLLVVHGKGRKNRVVPLNDECIYQITQYLNERAEQGITCTALFVNEKSLRTGGVGLGREGIIKLARKLGQRGDMELQTHKVRRFFATKMAERGMSATTLTAVLGHESFDTTLTHYADINSETTINDSKRYI